MSEYKEIYNRVFQEIRDVINRYDPEELEPGKEKVPEDEYDQEISPIAAFAIHNQEKIKLKPEILVNKINSIWTDFFGHNCNAAEEIAKEIIAVII